MKIIKSILYTLLILLMLLVGFLITCHFKPEITDSLATFLYGDENDPEGGKKGLFNLSSVDEDELLGMKDYDVTPDDSYPYINMPYRIPDVSRIKVPESFVSRVGYEEPVATINDVDDTTADEIINSLGTGPLGDELTFNSQFYPYYYMLDDNGKTLYRQVVANAQVVNNAFRPVTECSGSDVKKIMDAVYNDHPELFWLNTKYSCKARGGKNIVELDLSYNDTANDLDSSNAEFLQAAEDILSTARNMPNAFEQEKFVHDALATIDDYSLSAPMNQSAYSALVNRKTVCAGYARAMQYLMQQLGVPCYYCRGYAGENHAWNIIMLDNDYYNVDVTWDDANPTNYDYFNKSDSNYTSTHARRGLSINLPACNGTNYQVESTVAMEEGAEGDDIFPEEDEEYYPEDNEEPENTETLGEQMTGEDSSGYGDFPNEDGRINIREQGGGAYESPEVGNGDEPGAGSEADNPFSDDNNTAKRSLEDVGINENQVIYTLDDYFSDCKKKILENGKGSYKFANVIGGPELYNEWQTAYNTDRYKNEYLKEAMSQLGANGCQINLSAEELQNGLFLITHNLVLK